MKVTKYASSLPFRALAATRFVGVADPPPAGIEGSHLDHTTINSEDFKTLKVRKTSMYRKSLQVECLLK